MPILRRPKKTLQPAATEVAVIGTGSSATGLGVAAKGTLLALQSAYGEERSKGFKIEHLSQVQPAPVNIIQYSPTYDLQWVVNARAAGRKVIAYWVFEGSRPFEEMDKSASLFDSIWVPSMFCWERSRSLYTDYVPHPIEDPGWRRPKRPVRTSAIIVNSSSNWNRKNVHASIRAWVESKPPEDAKLIVKVQNGTVEQLLSVRWWMGKHKNIELLTDELAPEDMESFWKSIDCLISLHKSEGFGLTIAEAMMRDIPTVVTDYSGNRDFAKPFNSCAIGHKMVDIDDIFFPFGKWAYPDITSAAANIALLHEVGPTFDGSPSGFVKQLCDPETVGEKMKQKIENL